MSGIILLALWLAPLLATGQISVNRAPQFIANGDMARFAITEDTAPGSPVYKLQGIDPEGSSVLYSISGEFFTVDQRTGVVTLAKALDRETQEFITVVISITDEGIAGSQPNTISLLREIPILDINDNPPIFEGRPYSINLFETTPTGTKIYRNITVTDKDGGINGDVILSCVPPSDSVCSTFDILTEKISEGKYQGIVTLLKPLDYERHRSYSLTLKATDRAKDPSRRLSATANVVIQVEDVQDQPPVFLNAPYSATTPENTPDGTTVLRVGARDGDVGDPRFVRLDILDDILGCFQLVPVTGPVALDDGAPVSFYDVVTTDIALDREHPDILDSGGIYSFRLRATELINGELPAEFSDTTLTIVVTDTDDQLPVFNQKLFHINISEEIGTDSPLPGLSMMVTDGDIGDNARYTLALRDVSRSAGVVSLHPAEGQGHTVVVLRVNDTSMLDFDNADDQDSKTIIFDVVASVENDYGVEREVASSRVFLHVQDANDNAPEFPDKSVHLSIPEDVEPGSLVAALSATDQDSGKFGQIRYVLKGFAASKFGTNSTTGGVYVGSTALDYESQKSYTLTLVAIDGGNRSSSVSVHIDVLDVNDNSPKFELKEFSRTIRTKSTSFQPEFFIKATDIDGPQQGGGRVRYEVIEQNFDGDIVGVDSETGEIVLRGEASPQHTAKGQYELTIRAWDAGSPPRSTDARVNIRVGYVGNQRPFFRGNAKHSNDISFYNFTVFENIKPTTEIYQLDAVDPDGAAGQLSYSIPENGKDNFEIDAKSGILKTSSYVDLDLERNPAQYILRVEVVDAGYPVAETGTVEVVIHVQDVNNKSPVFQKDSYVFYVSDDADVNTTLASVVATDSDHNPEIHYKLVSSPSYYDKAGLSVKHDNVFTVTNQGEIILTQILPPTIYNAVFKIQAEDINSEDGTQITTTEILIYIQSKNDMNPVFIDSTWNPKTRQIHIDLDEETSPNSIIYQIQAKDPLDNQGSFEFQTTKNEFSDYFRVNNNGEVVVLRRLDYENAALKNFTIFVRVVVIEDLSYEVSRKSSGERVVDLQQLPELRFADAVLEIQLKNINDFAPVFEQDMYRKRISEGTKHPEVILQVKAVDFDKDPIIYSLTGESASYFLINATTGEITLSRNASLDREKQTIYKFSVIGMDVPSRGAARQNQATVWLEALDVNDNAPVFTQPSYSTVIPENVPTGTRIASIRATDPDLGLAGLVNYALIDDGETAGLFIINEETGDVSTNRVLTGRGRADSYSVIIRASDKGDQALDAEGRRTQHSFSTEASLIIYIGDVVLNDGVPVFIRPEPGQRATVSEDAAVNTPVFQIIATDPDDPNSVEGQIRYKFLREAKQDPLPFKINAETGLISTRSLLDREKKSSYQLIIVAHDRGEIPQEATRLLQIDILDVDDHTPVFLRAINEPPLSMKIVEEVPNGSEVGLVQCDDPDIGDNAKIDYVISDGNSDGLFSVERTSENIAILKTANRLDRETSDTHLITIKCFKLADDGKKLNYLRPYNPGDLSERQITIKVDDIDDNGPIFKSNNITLGVRLNVPVDTTLTTLEATDPDSNSAPLEYNIQKISFHPVGKRSPMLPISDLFSIDTKTGQLRTVGVMRPFADGFFDVSISANNTDDPSRMGNTTARIFVLRDKSLLKFVFDKSPNEVQNTRNEIEHAVAAALGASVNIYDTQFLSKSDGSLDFSSASSCFQVIGNRSYTLEELEKLLNTSRNAALRKVFADYSITSVERCAGKIAMRDASWIQIWVLVVAAAIGVLAFISAVAICCCYARYKRVLRRRQKQLDKIIPVPSVADYMTIRPSGSSRPAASIMGSQMMLNKNGRSARGSQLTLHKGGSVLLNQPATQMGSQLIINPNKSQPIIMGSQMLTTRGTALAEAREDFGSQIMYEYVQDGTDNLAYDDT